MIVIACSRNNPKYAIIILGRARIVTGIIAIILPTTFISSSSKVSHA
jgi:hypothetical protein